MDCRLFLPRQKIGFGDDSERENQKPGETRLDLVHKNMYIS